MPCCAAGAGDALRDVRPDALRARPAAVVRGRGTGFQLRPLCAAAQGDPQRAYPTFSLALAALPEPHWSALTPAAPLRHWRLIEVGAGERADAQPAADRRARAALPRRRAAPGRAAGGHRRAGAGPPATWCRRTAALAERIAAAWSGASGRSALPVIQLCGDELPANAPSRRPPAPRWAWPERDARPVHPARAR